MGVLVCVDIEFGWGGAGGHARGAVRRRKRHPLLSRAVLADQPYVLQLESINEQVENQSFAVRRAAWRFKRRSSCRHGVLFLRVPPGGCKCMAATSQESDWELARFMPSLNTNLRNQIKMIFSKKSLAAIYKACNTAVGWLHMGALRGYGRSKTAEAKQ